MHDWVEGLMEVISTVTPDYDREGGWRYVTAWLIGLAALAGTILWLAFKR
jgi:hypothetical protein